MHQKLTTCQHSCIQHLSLSHYIYISRTNSSLHTTFNISVFNTYIYIYQAPITLHIHIQYSCIQYLCLFLSIYHALTNHQIPNIAVFNISLYIYHIDKSPHIIFNIVVFNISLIIYIVHQ